MNVCVHFSWVCTYISPSQVWELRPYKVIGLRLPVRMENCPTNLDLFAFKFRGFSTLPGCTHVHSCQFIKTRAHTGTHIINTPPSPLLCPECRSSAKAITQK